MVQTLTEKQWRDYDRDGYVRLGRIVGDEQLAAMQQRIDDIMLGRAKLQYDRMLMQLDAGGEAYGQFGEMSKGHKGATLGYRKIEELEFDPLFLAYMQQPLFRHICAHIYGADTSIKCFRAMFMNKPANKGTFLPWHQDRWAHLDRDPLITIYLTLDSATKQNGCIQLIPGSHKAGVINPAHGSGFLTDELAAQHCPDDRQIHLETAAGEVTLLHNWTLHSSDVNRSDIARRAFSICYMDAGTVNTRNADEHSLIFGEGSITPEAVEQSA